MPLAKQKKSASPDVYSVREVAKKLRISLITAYSGLQQRTIPHVKIGRRFVIPKASFDKWMETAGHQEVSR